MPCKRLPRTPQTILGGANTSGVLEFGNSANPGATHGSFVIGTFTADSSTQAFTFAAASGYDANRTQFIAMQLRVIPEPSAALLGGLGVLALLRRRRA